MQISMIGANALVAALAVQWAQAGHRIVVSDAPTMQTAQQVVDACLTHGLVAHLTPLAMAATGSRVVTLAVPWEAVWPTLDTLRLSPAQMVLVLTTRLQPDMSGQTLGLLAPADAAAAEVIARQMPRNRVVAAFPLVMDTTPEQMLHIFAQAPEVPLCGNEAAARRSIATLLRRAGMQPHDVGGLECARVLETLQVSWAQFLGMTHYSAASAVRFLVP